MNGQGPLVESLFRQSQNEEKAANWRLASSNALMIKKSSFFALFDTGKAWAGKRRNGSYGWTRSTLVRRDNGGELVDWLHKSPNYNMPWNFGYYQKLFENYGFQIYFNSIPTPEMWQNVGFDDKLIGSSLMWILAIIRIYPSIQSKEKSEEKAPEYFMT